MMWIETGRSVGPEFGDRVRTTDHTTSYFTLDAIPLTTTCLFIIYLVRIGNNRINPVSAAA